MLENEIIPLYYAHNSNSFSHEWVQYIKKSMAEIAPRFNTKRMMDDYFDRFYNKLAERSKRIQANNYAKAREIVKWKEATASQWDTLEVVKVEFNPNVKMKVNNDPEEVYGRVVIDKKNLPCDIGVEVVVIDHDNPSQGSPSSSKHSSSTWSRPRRSRLYFETAQSLNDPGTHQYGLRVFPKHPGLPHRQRLPPT